MGGMWDSRRRLGMGEMRVLGVGERRRMGPRLMGKMGGIDGIDGVGSGFSFGIERRFGGCVGDILWLFEKKGGF